MATKEEEEKARKDAEEKARADASGKMDAILDGIAAISKQCDSMRSEMDAMKGRMDAIEGGAPAGTAADKAKKDAEEKERKDAEEKAAKEKEEKDRKDAEEKAAKEKEEKDRKDAEAREKEEKDRKDAAAAAAAGDPEVKKRLAAVEAAVKPRTLADQNVIAGAWNRTNAILTALGDSNGASPAMPGEEPLAYRRRLLEPLKVHSAAWKDVDLATLPEKAFDAAETQIREAAMDAAMSPSTVPNGGLREIRSRNGVHEVVTWAGCPSGWMNRFAGGGQRATGEFKTRIGGAR